MSANFPNVNTLPQTTITTPKTENKKEETPSAGRMALRYGLALPFVYELGDMGVTFVKATKQKRNFIDLYGEKFVNAIDNFQTKIEKAGTSKAGKALAFVKASKVYLALGAAGAGLGVVMKNLTDKNPDSKVIKAMNTAASFLGI